FWWGTWVLGTGYPLSPCRACDYAPAVLGRRKTLPDQPHRGESVRLRLDQCLVPRAGRTIAGPGVPIGLPVLHLSTPDGAGRRQARPQRWVLATHHTGP